MADRCSIIDYLGAESMQRWFSAIAGPLWPGIKVKFIETSMSIQGIHKSTVMPILNATAEIAKILSELWQIKK